MKIKSVLNRLVLRLLASAAIAVGGATAAFWILRDAEQSSGNASIDYRIVKSITADARQFMLLQDVASFGDAAYLAMLLDGSLQACYAKIQESKELLSFRKRFDPDAIETTFENYVRASKAYIDSPENAALQKDFQIATDTLDTFLLNLEKLAEAQAEQEIEQVRTLRTKLSLGGIISVLLLIAYMIRQSRRSETLIARPIRILDTSARKAIKHGQSFDERTDGPDEIQGLAQSFGAFANRLQSLVDQQTKELKQSNHDLAEEAKTSAKLAKQAEASNIAKSQFLAAMSHEIRTPLNGLLGVLHLLEDDSREKRKEYIEIAMRSGDNLLSLINDVLDFSKIEAGAMEIECIPFSLQHLIEDTTLLFLPKAREKNLELSWFADAKTWGTQMGDPNRLRQIVGNLVGNAIKFTEKGEIEVGATRLENSENEATFRIWIKDTGIGITSKTKTRLFETFTQADASTTRKYGGTGLGLAISKALAEMMNGQIGLDSEPGEGSTFWIELPLGETACQFWEDGSGTLKEKNALLLTNAAFTTERISYWFKRWDISLTVSDQASSILNNLSKPFDFILYEQALLQSESLRDALRQARKPGKTRLIAITQIDEGTPPQTSNRVNDPHLSKPISPVQLLTKLCETESSAIPHANQETAEASKPSFPDAKVLLVDDNPANRVIASALLERWNVTPDTASDGNEAIEACTKQSYDLILMDCMMPDVDGYQATQSIRSGNAGPLNLNTPIIALTANAMTGDREQCLNAGMNDYLSKPISPKKLLEKFQVHLNTTNKEETEETESLPPQDEKKPIPETNKLPLMDLSRLIELFGENRDLINQMLETFLESLAEQNGNLQAAISDGENLEKIRLHSHAIKGSSANFGADALREIAWKMEQACVENNIEQAIAFNSNFSETVTATTIEVQALIKEKA